MKATTSDKVGWIVGLVLAIVVVILLLWPWPWPKKETTPPAGGGGQNGGGESTVKKDGIAVAGSPVDEKGAPRQAVGAGGIPENNAPAVATTLHKIQPVII